MENNLMLTDITLNPKEYYQFRLLALQHRVMFTVEWTKQGALITCETPFLIAFGYINQVEF